MLLKDYVSASFTTLPAERLPEHYKVTICLKGRPQPPGAHKINNTTWTDHMAKSGWVKRVLLPKRAEMVAWRGSTTVCAHGNAASFI